MATYVYRSNMPTVDDTLAGVVFTAGVNVTYSSDQYALNRYVPARLDRWVDGVLSNTDLIIPDNISNQERYNALSEVNLTEAEVNAVKTAVGNGTIGSGVGVTVVDSLVSSSSTSALSANQGLVLKGLFDTTAEVAVDAVAAALAAGTHSNITINYDDAGNSISVTAAGGAGATNISATPSATTVVIASDTGTDGTLVAASATAAGLMLPADVTKLAGIAPNATANSADSALLDRTNHTGTQLASTVSDFNEAAQDAVAAALAAGTHSNVTVTYSDTGNSISITAAGGAGATNISATPSSTNVVIASDTGTDGTLVAASSTSAGLMMPADVTKLAGIAAGATANSADSALLDRTNHTGTQTASTISDFTETAQDAIAAALAAGTHSNVTVTYSDVGNAISITASGGGSSAPLIENVTTGTGYTLVAGDANKVKRFVDTAAQVCNITTAFNGYAVTLEWPAGSGVVTLDAATGVTLNGLGDAANIVLSDAGGMVSIIPTGTNTWDVIGAIGDLVAADITDSGATGRTILQATSTGAAQSAIALVPGTNVQAFDATLSALAGLTIAANTILLGTGTDTFSVLSLGVNTVPGRSSTGAVVAKTVSDLGFSLLANTATADMQTTLSLIPGTHVQAYDVTLAALAGLTIAADSILLGTGADAFSVLSLAANTFPARSSAGNVTAKTITDTALSILDDTSVGQVQTTLSLVPGTDVQAYNAYLAKLAAAAASTITAAGTLTSANLDAVITVNNATAIGITLAADATLLPAVGKSIIHIFILGAGVPTISAGTATILGTAPSGLAQYSSIVLFHTGATDTWAYA